MQQRVFLNKLTLFAQSNLNYCSFSLVFVERWVSVSTYFSLYVRSVAMQYCLKNSHNKERERDRERERAVQQRWGQVNPAKAFPLALVFQVWTKSLVSLYDETLLILIFMETAKYENRKFFLMLPSRNRFSRGGKVMLRYFYPFSFQVWAFHLMLWSVVHFLSRLV